MNHMIEFQCPCTQHLLDPNQRIIKLRINGFNILHDERLVQHSLIERKRETAVDELTMIQCLR